MLIYKVTNKKNGKCYIGQTTQTFNRRRTEHIYNSKKNTTNNYFYNALKKYGKDNFEWEIIDDTCQTIDELNEMEFHYIKQYCSYMGDNGYNMSYGGDNWPRLFGELNGMYGKKRPDITGDNNPAKRPEVREKISKSNKGKKNPWLSERNKQNKGKTFEEIYGVDKAKELRSQMKNRKTRANLYTFRSINGDIITTTKKDFSKQTGITHSSVNDLIYNKFKSGIHKGWMFMCKGKIMDINYATM